MEPLNDPPRWRVFRGELSGRYFAARCRHLDNDRWEVVGDKHDVTDDVHRCIDEADDR